MLTARELAGILERLNEGGNGAAARQEARRFLSSVSMTELAAAEHVLLHAGTTHDEFRRLCAEHTEMMEGQMGRLMEQLEPGHVIHTLTAEHEMILCFLDDLAEVHEALQAMDRLDPGRPEFARLRHIAEHLVEADGHHKREEEVLFPELARRGVVGPAEVLKQEHQALRTREQELKRLADEVADMDLGQFQDKLNRAVAFIGPALRQHIAKEDNVLYPTALRVIEDEEVWARLKVECDRIGYCCFTPVV